MSASDYPYRPLDGRLQEIRVLQPCRNASHAPHELPGGENLEGHLLQFEVKTLSLIQDPIPQFYAVSYTWGDAPAPAQAILDSNEYAIPDSAEAALRGLLKAMAVSSLDCSVPIWIDAVCINQNDLAEKSIQVANMGNVYLAASCVLVWLGEDDDKMTEVAMKSLEALGNQCLKWTDGEDDLEKNELLNIAERRSLPYWEAEVPEGCDFAAMESLIGCKYFSRLWVFQEVVLARKLVWFRGLYRVDWQEFSLAARWAFHMDHMWRTRCTDPRQFLRRVVFIRRAYLLQRYGRRITVQEIDEYFSSMIILNARNPRDKIYAILGLLNHASESGNRTIPPVLQVDYNRPLVDIHAEVTLLSLASSPTPLQTLQIGQRFCLPSDVDSSWPSWVPQLHKSGTRPAATIYSEANAGTCRLALVAAHPSDPNILQIAGTVFDTIKCFWRPLFDPIEDEGEDPARRAAVCKHFAYLWGETFSTKCGRAWNKQLLYELASTLAPASPRNKDEMIKDFAALLLEAKKHCTETIDPQLESLISGIGPGGDLQTSIDLLIDRGCFYSLFVTASGRFGLAGNHIAEGDKVCILYGAQDPFVIRPWGNVWKMRGTCKMNMVSNAEFERVVKKSEQWIFDVN